MAQCKNCGLNLAEGTQVCPQCGAPQAAPPQYQQPTYQQPAPPPQQYQQPAPPPQQYQQPQYQQPPYGQPQYQQPGQPMTEAQDIAANKVMAILSYFGILVLIPWLAAPGSKFARFHAKQGVKLCILWVGAVIVSILLGLIRIPHNVTETFWGITTTTTITSTPWYISIISTLLFIGVGVLAIIGIINAATGKFKELPLLDKIPLFK